MIVYENDLAQVIAYIAWLGYGVGAILFVCQVIRWDKEYEDFLIFPLRLAIYCLPYVCIPGLGILIGSLMLRRSNERVNRKFAKVSIYVSSVSLLMLATAPWTGIA
jgi:hypothetical protein